jgi:hypothetical protein
MIRLSSPVIVTMNSLHLTGMTMRSFAPRAWHKLKWRLIPRLSETLLKQRPTSRMSQNAGLAKRGVGDLLRLRDVGFRQYSQYDEDGTSVTGAGLTEPGPELPAWWRVKVVQFVGQPDFRCWSSYEYLIQIIDGFCFAAVHSGGNA